jgi:hypothetical protein
VICLRPQRNEKIRGAVAKFGSKSMRCDAIAAMQGFLAPYAFFSHGEIDQNEVCLLVVAFCTSPLLIISASAHIC